MNIAETPPSTVGLVLDEAVSLLRPAPAENAGVATTLASRAGPSLQLGGATAVTASVLLALVPKCPFCWAAYLSAAGVSGLPFVPDNQLVRSVLMALVVTNAAFVWAFASSRPRTSRLACRLLSLCGGAAVVTAACLDMPAALFCGSVLVAAAARLGPKGHRLLGES